MLISFRSKATSGFFMFDHHARPLFELMGKPFSPQGVINGASAGAFAATLSAALEAVPSEEAESEEDASVSKELPVGLKQRAWPLLEMLRRAAAKSVDVVWGSDV